MSMFDIVNLARKLELMVKINSFCEEYKIPWPTLPLLPIVVQISRQTGRLKSRAVQSTWAELESRTS